jgi:hypothetical protein
MKTLFDMVAFGTRICCALSALGMVLISFPFAFLASEMPQGGPFIPPLEIILFIIGAAIVLASGFVMFAIGWPARLANLAYRCTTFFLLLLPLAVGVTLLMAARTPIPSRGLPIAIVLFTCWLLLLCVKPALLNPGGQEGTGSFGGDSAGHPRTTGGL